MTTLLVNGARQIGTNLIQAAGQYAQNYAVQSVSRLFDNRNIQGPRLDSFHIQTSRDGAPMARMFGRSRLAGQVIWASRVLETATEERVGGKGGGPTQTNFSYSVSFAVGLCEGEILSVDRIWVNGAILPISDITMRVHNGGDNQSPDPVIQAIEGPNVPAFNNTAYVVFEDFPLDDFGGRLPQLSFEVQRIPNIRDGEPRLEDLVQSVCLLPSSGEFAYASEPVEDILGAGQSSSINVNNLTGLTDIERALDQLETQLPNCRHVSIIISWFGTDLRMENCTLRPGIEQSFRTTEPLTWSVGGIKRNEAYLINRDEQNRPVFGGTPSDASILQAIDALKSRGFSVTLYPFILMDIPPENELPNPYSEESGQPAFPWRGRITCHPAPGQPDTPYQTDALSGFVDDFMGQSQISDFSLSETEVITPKDDFGYRRFILHYAHLAKLSGNVDNFLIGSELRSLTQLRDSVNGFPFVTALSKLADDVAEVLGSEVQLSYAADWSEYFGYHPQDDSGDVFFHLDELWANPVINAVGIDSYMPLSDWRDGDRHIDGRNYEDIYDISYLQSNVLGGEGFDWFYANEDDRASQNRSAIRDGLHGEHWIFRFKDVQNWWRNEHYNRIGGVVSETPTAWVPQSKPFWITELGCPAVDKGANQPNVFVDPKSSESFFPYFSSETRDDLMQRRYIESYLDFWAPENGRNLTSSVYDGAMIDLSRTSIWTWDARPFPDFPARRDIWADGGNWELGHWLTGRTGLVPLADVVDEITRDTGLDSVDVSRVTGLVEGYVIDRPMTARAALEPLALIYGFNVIERAEALSFVSDGFETVTDIETRDMIEGDENGALILRADMESELLDVRLQFIDGAQDYQLGSLSARNRLAETVRVLDLNAPIVLSLPLANFAAETLLAKSSLGRERLSMSLSPGRLDVEVGDIIRLPEDETLWLIGEMQGEATQINIRAARVEPRRGLPPAGSRPVPVQPIPQTPRPFPIFLDIADMSGRNLTSRNQSGPLVGARLVPFSPTEISLAEQSLTLQTPPIIGMLASNLARGAVGRKDYQNTFEVVLLDGTLSSVDEAALLSGANHFTVQTALGWEILAAQEAVLVGPRRYKLSILLRGLAGSDADMAENILPGAMIVLLSGARGVADDGGLGRLALSNDLIDADLTLQAFAAGRESHTQEVHYVARHLRPFAPVHGRYNIDTRRLSWIRRGRIDNDRWSGLDIPLGEAEEIYDVKLYRGDEEVISVMTSQPYFDLPSDFTTPIDYAEVAQGSETYGFGSVLKIPIGS